MGTPIAERASAMARVISRGLRAWATGHSRAQRAATMAECYHERPADMRALYLDAERTVALKGIAAAPTMRRRSGPDLPPGSGRRCSSRCWA